MNFLSDILLKIKEQSQEQDSVYDSMNIGNSYLPDLYIKGFL